MLITSSFILTCRHAYTYNSKQCINVFIQPGMEKYGALYLFGIAHQLNNKMNIGLICVTKHNLSAGHSNCMNQIDG